MTHPTPPLYDPLYPIGFQKFTSGYKGMAWVEEHFLNYDKWQIKLLSEFSCN